MMPAKIPYTSEVLAQHILAAASTALPSSTVFAAKKCLLDIVGSAIAGWDSRNAMAMRDVARNRAGTASVWFDGSESATEFALLANTTAACALDVDDGNRSAGGHPGAAVIPAALSAAEHLPVSGEHLLRSIAVGYEAALAIATSRDMQGLYALSTGRWGGYGAVAAAAVISRPSAQHLAQALAISGELSPWLVGSGFSKLMGNQVKEGIPWAVHTGLLSLDMARAGMTGPLDLLDNPQHYDARHIVSDFGVSYRIEKTYYKPYACCRWIHSALDALSELMAENHVSANEIDSLLVSTVARGATLNNDVSPANLESAQYSFPFCLAALAVKGPGALLPMAEDLLGQADIIELAQRVEIKVDHDLDRLFPAQCPAEIRLQTKRGVWSRRVDDALGDPGNPMSMDQLVDKYMLLAEPKLGAARAMNLCQIILHLESAVDTVELSRALRDQVLSIKDQD